MWLIQISLNTERIMVVIIIKDKDMMRLINSRELILSTKLLRKHKVNAQEIGTWSNRILLATTIIFITLNIDIINFPSMLMYDNFLINNESLFLVFNIPSIGIVAYLSFFFFSNFKINFLYCWDVIYVYCLHLFNLCIYSRIF